MTFQESLIVILVPRPNPSVNPGAVHLQAWGNLAGGLPLDAEHDALEPQRDAGCFVGLGGLAKSLEPLEGSGLTPRKDRWHG
jgi:hypothetical protein